MTDAELFMAMRAAFRDAEAFVEAAADRIEAQAAEIERLRGELAKAQGALHQIAGKKDYADDPWDIARTALAELTGASHD